MGLTQACAKRSGSNHCKPIINFYIEDLISMQDGISMASLYRLRPNQFNFLFLFVGVPTSTREEREVAPQRTGTPQDSNPLFSHFRLQARDSCEAILWQKVALSTQAVLKLRTVTSSLTVIIVISFPWSINHPCVAKLYFLHICCHWHDIN